MTAEYQTTLGGERQAGLEETAEPQTCDRCDISEEKVDVVSFGPLEVCKICESAHDEGKWEIEEVLEDGE